MKKTVLAFAGMALLLSSCNNKESVFEITSSYFAYNLIVPADGAEPFVTKSNYLFKFSNETLESFSSSDFSLGAGNYTFSTGVLNSKQGATVDGGGLFIFSGNGGTVDNMPLTDINGSVTGIVNYTPRPVIGLRTIEANKYGPLMFASFNVGDKYKVKTFFNDLYFSGTTKTKYQLQGEDKTYETTGILYRLVFASDFKTASLVIYDGKFAAEQPDKGVYDYLLLTNLPVKLTSTGYEISANGIIPQYEEGGALENQTRYMFNNIEIKNNGQDLSEISIKYSVAGMYYGEFLGQCAVTTLWK